jgi:DNA-binding MarR family transcriptional regulator
VQTSAEMAAVASQIRRLLEAPFDTFEKLELTAALWRATAHTQSPAELAKQTQLPPDMIDRALADLVAAKYVEIAGGLARLVVRPEDLAGLRALVELYDSDRILIVRVLSEISMDKIRGMAARAFADAFQLRKKPGGDGG